MATAGEYFFFDFCSGIIITGLPLLRRFAVTVSRLCYFRNIDATTHLVDY